MLLPTAGRLYLTNALDHAPAMLSALLSAEPAPSPLWDFRRDVNRFSLREIVAHLADWEPIFRDRIERTATFSPPKVELLERPNLEERAIAQGYGTADPQECLARFAEHRTSLTAYLRALPEDHWDDGQATLDRMGLVTVEALVSLILAHDAYHLRQVAEWLTAGRQH